MDSRCLALIGQVGTWLAGVVGKGAYYLRHIPWRYAMDHSDEIGHELKLLKEGRCPGLATTLAVLAALVSPVASVGS